MTDEERVAFIAASTKARVERYADETKYCPACGSRMLGGVMGDLSLLGCCACGERMPKYRLGLA